MPKDVAPSQEPSTAELLEGWRSAERSASAAERAAAAAERAAAAAERAAAATELVAEAAQATVAAAQASLDVVRASVIEARSAATASKAESVDTTEAAQGAQDATTTSRDLYQQRIADLREVRVHPPRGGRHDRHERRGRRRTGIRRLSSGRPCCPGRIGRSCGSRALVGGGTPAHVDLVLREATTVVSSA